MSTYQSRTIIDDWGRVIFWGLQDCYDKIVTNNFCFICGRSPDSKMFNNEHVIPNWLLRKYNLHNESITLPNKKTIPYSQYKVPCCKECNSQLGKVFELPISRLFSMSYEDIIKKIDERPKELTFFIYQWMSLVFFKMHLKDNLFINRQSNSEMKTIGNGYDWSDMHHIHCVVRSHYTNAKLDTSIMGSMYFFPAEINESELYFDYIDSFLGKTIMIRIGECAVISVLDDSGACCQILNTEKLSMPLNNRKLREVFSHLSYISVNLKEKPTYASYTSKEEYIIKAIFPKEPPSMVDERDRILSPKDFFFISSKT